MFDSIDNNDLKASEPETFDNQNGIEFFDLTLVSGMSEIVEKCFKKGNHLHIELIKPQKDAIIVTIGTNYSIFRDKVKKQLKEKGLSEDRSKNILSLIDLNYQRIYEDSHPMPDNGLNNSSCNSDKYFNNTLQ